MSIFKKTALAVAFVGAGLAAQPAAADANISFGFSIGNGGWHGGGWHGGYGGWQGGYGRQEAVCVAVGFRANGHGPRVRGSRSRASLPVRAHAPYWRKQRRLSRACDQALRECQHKISYLAGPWAVCRVTRNFIR